MSEKLISAERLKQVLDKNFGHTGGAAVLEQLIDIAPAVDAVEVVRCKDCEHLRVFDGESLYAMCCETRIMFYQKTHSLFAIDARTHYCSLGERREENEID